MVYSQNWSKKSDYSLATLIIAITLTFLIIVINNFAHHKSQTQISTMINKVRKLEEYKGQILLLDETLTNSATMALQTGDVQWQERYHEARKKLDSYFDEIISTDPNTPLSTAAAKTSLANYYLVEIETQALSYLNLGERQKGLALLNGDNYKNFKTVYTHGMSEFSNSLLQAVAIFDAEIKDNSDFVNRISFFATLFISALWIFVFRFLYLWRKDLIAQNHELDTRFASKSQQLDVEPLKSLESAKMAALGKMAGSIAHEINTPLQVIRLKIHLLEKTISNDDIGLIKNMTEKIAKIVQGMQIFSRESKGDDLTFTNLKPIIESTLEICRARTQKGGVKLEVDPIPDDLKLKCKPTQISQVLLNLLNNAYDAIENKAQKTIRVALKNKSDAIEIDILDSGDGVDPKIEGKIMQPYFTTKGIGKGTGLGLSISKNIMRDHGGELSFSRTDDHFTCFSMRFPNELLSGTRDRT